MRLIDLRPTWLCPSLFVFLCPHCQKDWLTVKDIAMMRKEQYELFEREFGPSWNLKVVPANPDFAWTFSSRNFGDMSVTPSVDASSSGHWHGHITKGAII